MSSETFYIYCIAEAAELFCFLLVQTGEERERGGKFWNWPRAQEWQDPSLISLVVYFIGMKLRSLTLREGHTLRALTSEEPATVK